MIGLEYVTTSCYFLLSHLIHIAMILRKCLPCYICQDQNIQKTRTASVHFFFFLCKNLFSPTPRYRENGQTQRVLDSDIALLGKRLVLGRRRV